MISSSKNEKLKQIRQLLTSVRARKEEGLFVAEGVRLVKEVPVNLAVALYLSEDFTDMDAVDHLIKAGVPAETVAASVFKSLSDTQNPQGVLAVVKKPGWQAENILLQTASSGKELYIILDDIRDPGNLGTIVRTAEAAGVKAVYMSEGTADLYNPKVIRSTMGSIFRVPCIEAELTELIPALKFQGVKVWAAALTGSVDYREADYGPANAFVIGNEANGVSEEVISACTGAVKIPMAGQVESLNAAISAAVLMFR